MLEKLTKKQIELQSVVRDEWIDIALRKTNFDKEELEAGVKWLYYSSNLKEPKVVFVEGPKDFSKKLLSKKWASVGASVRASVGASVWDSVSWCSLAYDSDWASWYDFYNKIGVINHDKANQYIGYLKAGAFYVMMFEKKCFVMKRPVVIEQNERKQLHSTKGPALVFADGVKVYKLNGVTFEKKWWTKVVKDKFSPEEIFAIDNLEHRRIAYEYMDKTKMKKLKDFKVLDETIDVYKNPMKVISFSVKNVEEPLKYLNVFCPTTGREYFIGTAEDKCNQAKAKSFGFKEEEIEFIQEW